MRTERLRIRGPSRENQRLLLHTESGAFDALEGILIHVLVARNFCNTQIIVPSMPLSHTFYCFGALHIVTCFLSLTSACLRRELRFCIV